MNKVHQLVLALFVLVLFVFACADDESVEPTLEDVAEPPVSVEWPGVTIEAIFRDPNAFIGKSVIVHGEVVEIIEDTAFVIRDEGETMLIVGPDLPIEELREGVFVRVNGAVRDFDIAEIEDELGFGLQDNLFIAFSDEPAIIASVVTIGVTSVDDLLENVGVFVGQTVNVTGQVEEVISERVFALHADEAGDPLLVIEPVPVRPEDLEEGVWVRVVGPVRILNPADFEELGDEITTVFEGDLAERRSDPLIVAEMVEIVAPRSTVAIADLLAEPEQFAGQTVTVHGPVENVPAEGLFVLEAEGGLLGLLNDEILVVDAISELPGAATPGAVVVVTGTVRILDPAAQDTAQDLGLDPEIREAFEGQPVIVAESVTVIAQE